MCFAQQKKIILQNITVTSNQAIFCMFFVNFLQKYNTHQKSGREQDSYKTRGYVVHDKLSYNQPTNLASIKIIGKSPGKIGEYIFKIKRSKIMLRGINSGNTLDLKSH